MVYVNDIIITSDDKKKIGESKAFLQNSFQTKDIRQLRYFWGIVVACSKYGISLSSRKCVGCYKKMDLLGSKSVTTPMGPNVISIMDPGSCYLIRRDIIVWLVN
jgi:hypothetical protein